MLIFSTTLSQMAFLFSLIIVGYLMAKLVVVQACWPKWKTLFLSPPWLW